MGMVTMLDRLPLVGRYGRWLHGQWPAGHVEKLPVVHSDGSTRVPGLLVVGDLTGIPLLKFSADTGAKAAQRVAATLAPPHQRAANDNDILDLAIIGGGVSGFAAALEAQRLGLNFKLFEASEPFSTIVNFPAGKPIYTYPTDLTPAGELQFHEDQSHVKEGLLADLRQQTTERGINPVIARVERVKRRGPLLELVIPDQSPVQARQVIVAIGRSGNYRQLNVPGEDLPKVYNRLHDPKEYAGQQVLVVGGGDSALEAAIALAQQGAAVTLSYRQAQFSRPKPENVEKLDALAEPVTDDTPAQPGRIALRLPSQVKQIAADHVTLKQGEATVSIPNDVVLRLIGREAPLDFFRRSGVPIHGERNWRWWVTLLLCVAACLWLYHWKKPGVHIANFPPLSSLAHVGDAWAQRGWFPYNIPERWTQLGSAFAEPSHLLGTLKLSLGEPGFYYSLAYCLCVVLFGVDRMRRRRTPYVTVQTLTLMFMQCGPLFLLPYVLLPWAGYNGWFDAGGLKWLADQLFPVVTYGHGREYWRAFGLILAWPLFIWNAFTSQPLGLWLAISAVQTFVIIPLLVWRFGKGAYCGWICSCGALAETLGDRHRQKMPHGPGWNRLNLIGQVFLLFAVVLMVLRTLGWMLGHDSWPSRGFEYLLHDLPMFNYVWFVDLLWAGVLGVGLYFHFSGRVWCRFACPLAALMHIYARFSQFRILADKKKCISCNVCTSVCHQGIDVMSFANKGKPMEDPQCVRCSACVQSCPTGVLSFGRVGRAGQVLGVDTLAASPVRLTELTISAKHS